MRAITIILSDMLKIIFILFSYVYCVWAFFILAFEESGLFELIVDVVHLPAVRISPWGVIRAKDEPIAFLLTGARHLIPMRAYKFCCTPGVFAIAGRISLRGRPVMPSASLLRVCITSKCNHGD